VTEDITDKDHEALKTLANALAELLDKVCVRAEAGYQVQRQLTEMMANWIAGGGSAVGKSLLQKSQGVTGSINSSREGDATRDLAYRHLVEFKNELRALARKD
jgi:2-phosphoglycerate kinase